MPRALECSLRYRLDSLVAQVWLRTVECYLGQWTGEVKGGDWLANAKASLPKQSERKKEK